MTDEPTKNELTLWQKFQALQGPQKGQVTTAVIVGGCLLLYGLSHWKRLSSTAPPPTSNLVDDNHSQTPSFSRPIKTESPSRQSSSRQTAIPVPRQPTRTAKRPDVVSTLFGLLKSQTGNRSSQPEPPVKRRPDTPSASDIPLKAGDVFHGTAGRQAIGYVQFLFLDVDKVRRTVLLNVRLRDAPMWGIFTGLITPTGNLQFKQTLSSGRSPTPPPAAELVGGGTRMALWFVDKNKLTGRAGGVMIDLKRDVEASEAARKRLLKAPIAAVQWKKFTGFTNYQPNPKLAGFGSAQARQNLKITLHIGSVNEELKQVLAILSVEGHPSWKAYLRGSVLPDGISIRFSDQVGGIVEMAGPVGEFIRKNRNFPVDVLLTPDGQLRGHRGSYFFVLNPLPGEYKPAAAQQKPSPTLTRSRT